MQAWLRCFLLADDLNFGHCFSHWRKIRENMQDPPHQSRSRPSHTSSFTTCQPWAAYISCNCRLRTISHHSYVFPLGSLHLLYFDLFYPLSCFLWMSVTSTLRLLLAGAIVSVLRSISWLGGYYLFRLPVFICSVILVGMIFLQSALFCSWSSFLPFLIYSQFKA